MDSPNVAIFWSDRGNAITRTVAAVGAGRSSDRWTSNPVASPVLPVPEQSQHLLKPAAFHESIATECENNDAAEEFTARLRHSYTMSLYLRNPLVSLSRSFLRSPDWVTCAVAGTPVEINGRTLHRALQLMLATPGVGLGKPAMSVQKRRLLTNLSAQLGTPKIKNVDVVDRQIPGPESDIPIRIYRSFGAEPTPPTIVYYHGGGWVVGNLESHDGSCRALAAASKCVVVSVDYRLAPENPFPAAVDDALAAYLWAADKPNDLAARPGVVAVMGDSAGGNLAAVVAQQARDLGIQPPALQGLVYPSVDLNIDTQSLDPIGTDFFLTLDDIDWFRDHYLDPDSPELRNDPRVSPLLGELTDLPPALVWTAGFDPLLAEGVRYAKALAEAGNQVKYYCYDDQTHGFLNMGILPGGMLRIAEIGRQMGSALRTNAN